MKTVTAVVNDKNINLKLRDSITVICGDSATGKTYLYETLRDAENTENMYFINYNSVKTSENYQSAIDFLRNKSNKLIIVDQADDVQDLYNGEIMEEININTNNHYFIIIGRQPNLSYFYSDMANVVVKDNTISLEYIADEPLF